MIAFRHTPERVRGIQKSMDQHPKTDGSANEEIGRRFRIEVLQDKDKLNFPELTGASCIYSAPDHLFNPWVLGVGGDPTDDYPANARLAGCIAIDLESLHSLVEQSWQKCHHSGLLLTLRRNWQVFVWTISYYVTFSCELSRSFIRSKRFNRTGIFRPGAMKLSWRTCGCSKPELSDSMLSESRYPEKEGGQSWALNISRMPGYSSGSLGSGIFLGNY